MRSRTMRGGGTRDRLAPRLRERNGRNAFALPGRRLSYTCLGRKESPMAVTSKTSIKRPVLHHVLLKTTRLQETIDWYAAVVGCEVVFQDAGIAFLSNDGANHRIS